MSEQTFELWLSSWKEHSFSYSRLRSQLDSLRRSRWKILVSGLKNGVIDAKSADLREIQIVELTLALKTEIDETMMKLREERILRDEAVLQLQRLLGVSRFSERDDELLIDDE